MNECEEGPNTAPCDDNFYFTETDILTTLIHAIYAALSLFR